MRVPPPACAVPTHHVQAACGDDLDCLLGEFAATVQADAQVDAALAVCPGIRRVAP